MKVYTMDLTGRKYRISLVCLSCQANWYSIEQDKLPLTINLVSLANDNADKEQPCACIAPDVGLRVELVDQAQANDPGPALSPLARPASRYRQPPHLPEGVIHADLMPTPEMDFTTGHNLNAPPWHVETPEERAAKIHEAIMHPQPVDALKQHKQDAFFDAYSSPATERTEC